MRRSARVLVLAACIGGLAACGGDDSPSTGADDDVTTTTGAGADASTTTAGSGATLPGGVTIPSIPGGGITIPSLPAGVTLPGGVTIPGGLPISEDCLVVSQTWATAIAGTFAGDRASLDRLDEAIESLGAIAPDEITGDVQVVATAFQTWSAVLAAHDYDFAKVLADPAAQQQLQALNSPEFDAAQDNVAAWLEQTCGGSAG